jgi:hypothetical protein
MDDGLDNVHMRHKRSFPFLPVTVQQMSNVFRVGKACALASVYQRQLGIANGALLGLFYLGCDELYLNVQTALIVADFRE